VIIKYATTPLSVLKEFLKLCNVWQQYGGKGDCLKSPVCWVTVTLKDEELSCDSDIWRPGTVVTASFYD